MERDASAFLDVFAQRAAGPARGALASLSVEAGSGTIALALLAAGRRVECIEDTSYRVARVRTRLVSAGQAGVRVREAPATALPFADESFDEVVWVLPILPQERMAHGLTEIERVLGAAGAATIILWTYPRLGPGIVAPGDASPALAADLAAPVVAAARDAGLTNVESEWCRCHCVAPTKEALSDAIRGAQVPTHVREKYRLAEGARAVAGEGMSPAVGVFCDGWIVRAWKARK